jgi:outer membrane lipoprotein-sorting protein
MILTLSCSAAWAQEKAAPPKPAAPEAAVELTDPTEILKKADEACKAVDSVKYTATFKGMGAGEAKEPKAEGTVYLFGFKNNSFEKARFEAKVTPPGSTEAKEVIMGTNGNEYYLIDPSKKIAYVDIDPAVLGGTGRMAGVLTMGEYVHDRPFSDEINAEKKEFKGSEKIGSEDTYHVWVNYGQQNQEADWYFSKKDFLPRRVDRKLASQSGGEPRGSRLLVTSLTVAPKPEKDPFKFELPEGYTKSDDFAP